MATERDIEKPVPSGGTSPTLSATNTDSKYTAPQPHIDHTTNPAPVGDWLPEADVENGDRDDKPEIPSAPVPSGGGPPGGHTFPDGGFEAWLVVLGAFIALFCSFGYLNAFGVYEAYYQKFILPDKSASAISWIGSIQVCLLFCTGIFAGSAFDRYGAPVIIIPASIGLVTSIMLTSICKQYWHFLLAQGILGGISQGMLFTPSMGAVNHFFFKKRGAAVGLVVAGSSLGGVIIPIMLNKLIQNPKLGFGWTVRIIGFMFLGLLVIACVTIKGRLPRRKGQFFKPEAFKQRSYALIVPGQFLMLWGLFVPFFYVPSYAIEKGTSVEMSIYLVSILNAASIPGRVIPGILADRIGRLNMLVLFPMMTSIIIWTWASIGDSKGGLIVWAVFFGFMSGGCVSLFPAALAQITPNPRDIGTYIGQATAIIGIAGLTGAPIAGQLLKYGWIAPIAFSATSILAGTCFTAASRFSFNPDWKAAV